MKKNIVIVLLLSALIGVSGLIFFLVEVYRPSSSFADAPISLNINNHDRSNSLSRSSNESSKKIQLFERLKEILNSPLYLIPPEIPSTTICPKLNYIGSNIEESMIIINGTPEQMKELPIVLRYSDLTHAQWEELIPVIKEKNHIRKIKVAEKEKKFQEELEKNGLFYFINEEKKSKESFSHYGFEQGVYYLNLITYKEGRRAFIKIQKGHQDLDNFAFQTGVYQIKTNAPMKKEEHWCKCSECLRERPYFWVARVTPADTISFKKIDNLSY